ncbi:MAG: 2-hydroxy-3-oxopropionate reductase [Alphaproteobacteria bacterium]|nr:2-hydroxy-3-oxopropionate reductase [Alphaproteobacteria bacterium]HCP00545.1 NAD(P)-dependent oxidoreductase [Rhodospirillaceae bacterium]
MTNLEGTKIGFIGLGLMGRPMAKNLHQAGAAVTVTNRSPGPAEELAILGASTAASPRDVVAACDIIIIMVTDTPSVDKVLHDVDGVFAGLAGDEVIIDMGTTKVRETKAWADEAKALGAAYVDAPVSGGTVGAEAGNLTIMVGASDDILPRVMPVFNVLGDHVTHIGDVGAGQVTKTANQAIVGMTLAAVAEGLTLAERAGVDPAKVRQALLGGFAESRVLDLHGGRMVERTFEPHGRASVHHKDILQALELAEQVGIDLVSLNTNLELWQKMMDRGWADLDQAGIIRAVEEK